MQRYCLIIFALFLSVSCNTGKYSDEGKSVFRYNEAAGITSLDPAFAKDLANIWACNQLFNGLVQMNEMLITEPCIARQWTISGDGLLYKFFLRNDVFFHADPVFKDGKGHRVRL
jgi:peptide/nickel transport system substrate-binding protein